MNIEATQHRHGACVTTCCGVPTCARERSPEHEARLTALWNTNDPEATRATMLRLMLSTWGALGARSEWVDRTLREAHVPAHVVETLVKQYRNETGR